MRAPKREVSLCQPVGWLGLSAAQVQVLAVGSRERALETGDLGASLAQLVGESEHDGGLPRWLDRLGRYGTCHGSQGSDAVPKFRGAVEEVQGDTTFSELILDLARENSTPAIFPNER